MNIIDTVIGWEHLPSLLALITGFSAAMALGAFRGRDRRPE